MIVSCRHPGWRPSKKNHRRLNCYRWFFLLVTTLVSTLPLSPALAAPQIVALQRLDFGVLAIPANSVSSALALSPLGTATYGSAYVYVAAATPGRYRLTGYPAFTDISVSMAPGTVSLSSGAPGAQLTVSAAATKPSPIRTDINGQAEFDLGATLTTSGSGQPYQDGTYLGRPTLTLSFSVAEVPQLSYQDIDVDLELRTSLAVAQVEPLNFGRLAVFSSPGSQASLALSPNGGVAINNIGAARIIRFGSETPGTFRVTTGAAFAPVTITLPTDTVYLVHQSQSADVARFLVTDFVALPATGDAKLNALGSLDFRVGATLRTEQTAKHFVDGEYAGTFSLNVEY
ncbi:MAG: hypothetical protein B7Y41_02155 [Hydrogenophilales bacterium 28-61-23]|nr:MAG: hypothetical protein B7Y41_02155 [Hydrogenophilales bacterium 28-61-23]